MISLIIWGNNIFISFEQGSLGRLLMYKNNQWEKLDFNFTYIKSNEVYIPKKDQIGNYPSLILSFLEEEQEH